MTTITVPVVAAHLLVTGVLRFLPTDADTECESAFCSYGWVEHGVERCQNCTNGRRPLRAGDRIAIRAGDDVPHHGQEFGQWAAINMAIVLRPDMHLVDGLGSNIPLRPGEVVGRATVARVLPIHRTFVADHDATEPHICVDSRSGEVRAYPGSIESDYGDDISDHLDAGLTFTPGSVALDLNVETTG